MTPQPGTLRSLTYAVLLTTVLVILAVPGRSVAQTLDAGSAAALAAVLGMLQDPASRNSALASDLRASALDQQMRSLAGSEAGLQEFYALAGEVFEELTRNADGDAGKMSAALQQAATDPARPRREHRPPRLARNASYAAASIQGLVASSLRAGHPVRRLRSAAAVVDEHQPRCARLEGFSLHATVAVPAHARAGHEHLCRYLLRPPLARERVSESSQGQLLYELAHPRADRSPHLWRDSLELIEK